jgi:hypothetical protein
MPTPGSETPIHGAHFDPADCIDACVRMLTFASGTSGPE